MYGFFSIAHSTDSIDSSERSTIKNVEDMLPRDMIHALLDESLVHKNLSSNHLGKLVLIKGKIIFFDYKQLLSGANSSIEFYLNHIADAEDKKTFKKTNAKQKIIDLAKVINEYPIQLQAYLQTSSPIGNDEYVWMSLQKEKLNNDHFDTAFKYNLCSEEDFYILGVFDAQPDNYVDDTVNADIDKFSQKIGSFGEISKFLLSVLTAYRKIVGRPEECYGITPVAIFRQLEG